jgi:hypothetical protein
LDLKGTAMKKLMILCAVLALGVLGTGCGGSKPEEPAVESPGSTLEKAIVIQSKNEKDGHKDQLDWLVKRYPDYQINKQTIQREKNQKIYNRVEITTGNGMAMTFYFDITGCFGMSESGPMHFK